MRYNRRTDNYINMARTTSSPLHKIQLYQFKDFDMSEFINRYLHLVNPHEVTDPTTLSVYRPAQTMMTQRKEGARSEAIIENKCKYLQDVIIRRAFSKKDNLTFSLNANILKSVIRNDYKPLLKVFNEMGYIVLGDGKGGKENYWYYKYGSYSYLYTLKNTEVCMTEPFFNQAIQAYKEKTIDELKNLKDKYTYKPIREKHGESFLKNYLKSLRLIKIEDEIGLRGYINNVLSKDNRVYYEYILKELRQKDKSIYRVDDSGRIYHILTNLDRNVKQYLNIDIALDCKNSHPLLFNYFIFNKLGISNTSSYQISKFLCDYQSSSVYNNRNVERKLRNLLNNSNIENKAVAKMSDDEIEYVYLSSTGQLWDEIVAKHPEMDRNEVKVEMFRAVFYAHSPVPDRWNLYAMEFKARFPNVFKLIGDWKRKKTSAAVIEYMQTHRLPSDRGSASLSIAMMALEADIFTSILKRLYAKRWNALHIHDCIIIPKDSNKNHPTRAQVEAIMADVYKDFGLAPTFA